MTVLSNSKSLRIYVDHWEDYESIGDQAMLLNALRRLKLYLGPCQFVGPLSPENQEKFRYHDMVTVVPPHKEISRSAASLQAIYKKITRYLPSIWTPRIKSTVFLDGAIFFFKFRYFLYSLGFKNVYRKSFQDFLNEIQHCDVFFTVGDCSLSDYWLDGVAYKSWLLKLVRPHVLVSVLSSQGIGPLTTPWARRRLVGALSTLDLLSFRDYANSKALVESEGLTGVPYKIVCDEAFTFPVADAAEVWKRLDEAGVPRQSPFIAVNFRTTDFTQNTAFLMDRISDLLDRVISSTHKKVVFVPMSSGRKYGCDYEAGLSLKGKMERSEDFYVLDPMEDIELAKGIIGAAKYSLGISYHLHVFSLSQGHPTLIVYTGEYYRTKSEGLVSFYGIPNRAVNFSETSLERTLEYVLEIDDHYADACACVEKVNQGILEKNDWTIQTLRNILVEKGLLSDGRQA
jgi:polysaccharide pyruvyl transferase WcaK-like protein